MIVPRFLLPALKEHKKTSNMRKKNMWVPKTKDMIDF